MCSQIIQRYYQVKVTDCICFCNYHHDGIAVYRKYCPTSLLDYRTIFSVGNLSITTAADGTTDKPAKVEWEPESTCGAKYLVEINGTEIRPDFMIGKQNSVEFHYFSLVMKDGNNKPDEVTICVEITAYCGKEIAGRSPPCDELGKYLACY